MIYKKLLFSVTIFILFYLLIVNIWYYNPTWFFGIKYKVKDNVNIDKIVDGPSLIVMDHRDPSNVDIMIMSDEVLKTNKKYTFLSGKSLKILKYLYYRTKYNIIEVKDDTVSKCTKSINNNENVVIFLREESKGKGIYYILKETKAPLFIVKKKLTKNPYNQELKGLYNASWQSIEYEIEYIKINDYDLEKTPEEFMNYIKKLIYD